MQVLFDQIKLVQIVLRMTFYPELFFPVKITLPLEFSVKVFRLRRTQGLLRTNILDHFYK